MFASLGRLLVTVAVAIALPCLNARSPAWATEPPTRGGTLRVALDMDPSALDPILSDAQNRDRNIFNLFYENLIRLDGGKPVPVLAESWTIAPDNKSITFRLRANVRFHDGTSFDAAAVKANLDRAASPETNPRTASDLIDIASVDVIDPLTVRISLKQPSGVVVANLAGAVAMMVSPRAFASPEDLKRKPVGTGPFHFVSWQNDTIIAERFDEYWGHDPEGGRLPYLDGVSLRFIRATAVKIVEARSGNVDLTDGIQTKDFAQIEREPSLQLSENPQGVNQYVAFNVTRPPFDNRDLRLAVLHGVNRTAVAKVIAGEYGLLTPTLIPPSWYIYEPSLQAAKYDPDLAKSHLEKSGFTGTVKFAVIKRDPDTQIAEIIQSQLKQIGLNVQIDVLERQAWLQQVRGYQYDMGMLRQHVPQSDPDVIFGELYARDAPANYAGLKDEALFKAVANGRSTIEPGARRDYYVAAQQILLDGGYYDYLFTRPLRDIVAKRVHGLKYESFGPWIYTDVWLAK